MWREMLPARFDFFLDEMIRPQNTRVIGRLERQACGWLKEDLLS